MVMSIRDVEVSRARWRGVALVWMFLGVVQHAAAEETAVQGAEPAPPASGETAASATRPAAPGAVEIGEEVLIGEIVVKGKRGPRTESLEAREVRERGARDLGEALSTLPSIAKVRKGGIANDIVLRGMKKDDVAVTIDGAKVHGACPSRMDPPAFHLDYAEVDVVQVKRGPFDVAQPGALAGAVDVRTRRGRAGVGTELNLEGGSASMMSGSLNASYGAPRYDMLVGASYKEGNPYLAGDGRNFTEFVPELVGTSANPARFRDQSDGQQAYRIGSGFARLGFVPADGQRVEVGYTRQSAPRALYPYLRMDGVADDTDRVTARWDAQGLGAVAASVSGYWSRVAHDMTDVFRCSSAAIPGTCGGALARDYSMGTFARSDVWGGQAEVRGGDPETLLGWRAGADFYARTWDNRTDRLNRSTGVYASEASIPDVRIQGVGLYAEARRSLGETEAKTRLVAGVRLDAARSEAGVDRTALFRKYYPDADLSLRRDDVLVGGNVQLERDLRAGLTAWAGYGHGARVPDPQERYIALTGMGATPSGPNPDWLGRPDLAPVRSDELDLGLTWRAPRIVVKTQLFHAWYADYIDLANVTPAPGSTGAPRGRSYENVAARTFGGEAAGRVALPANLFVAGSASYTRGINDSTGTSLAEFPPFKAALSLRWDDGRLFAEAEEIYASRQGFVDSSLQEEPTPAWWTTSLKAGAGWRGMKVFAMVQNLFDRTYVEHLSYQRDPFAAGFKVPEPGRSFQLAAQYAY
jgi:iron complex outermembrane receptor protein